MRVTNPKDYLEKIDLRRFEKLLSKPRLPASGSVPDIAYVEPPQTEVSASEEPTAVSSEVPVPTESLKAQAMEISGKVQRLGDFVDTDAVSSSF